MKYTCPRSCSVDIIGQSESTSRQNLEKFVCEMIAVVCESVVSVRCVLLPEPWNQYVVDLKSSQLTNMCAIVVLHWDSVLKLKGTIASWTSYVDA